MGKTNRHGQPIGAAIDGWTPPPVPKAKRLEGRTVTLERLDREIHGPPLFETLAVAPDSLWTYMSFGPFQDYHHFESTLEAIEHYPDWVPFAIVVDDEPLGFASYLRIAPRDGSIEIGSIVFAPQLQRTTPATEAIYLMMRNVFELGYRRCEWKCDDLNSASRKAAERLGFIYEGTFRQATLYKGRNRDTAWYAVTDREWPDLDLAFQRWLSPDNFDSNGVQLRSLRQMREGN